MEFSSNFRLNQVITLFCLEKYAKLGSQLFSLGDHILEPLEKNLNLGDQILVVVGVGVSF